MSRTKISYFQKTCVYEDKTLKEGVIYYGIFLNTFI